MCVGGLAIFIRNPDETEGIKCWEGDFQAVVDAGGGECFAREWIDWMSGIEPWGDGIGYGDFICWVRAEAMGTAAIVRLLVGSIAHIADKKQCARVA